MSLFNLVHKSVVIKFSDAAKDQFKPEASYPFRLVGVDAMGFLQIQNLKRGAHGEHEAASEAYWINKDLVREIHELDLAKHKGSLSYVSSTKAKAATPGDSAPPAAAPKVEKVKPPAKQKPILT